VQLVDARGEGREPKLSSATSGECCSITSGEIGERNVRRNQLQSVLSRDQLPQSDLDQVLELAATTVTPAGIGSASGEIRGMTGE